MECEVHVDGVCLIMSKFKYLGCVLDEAGPEGAECCRKVTSTIRSLVNARDLRIECAKVLHETLPVPVFMYGSETVMEGVGEI